MDLRERLTLLLDIIFEMSGKHPGRDNKLDLQSEVSRNWEERFDAEINLGGRGVVINREGNGYPLLRSCLKNPMDRGAWRAAVPGLQSQTRLSDQYFHFTYQYTDASKS